MSIIRCVRHEYWFSLVCKPQRDIPRRLVHVCIIWWSCSKALYAIITNSNKPPVLCRTYPTEPTERISQHIRANIIYLTYFNVFGEHKVNVGRYIYDYFETHSPQEKSERFAFAVYFIFCAGFTIEKYSHSLSIWPLRSPTVLDNICGKWNICMRTH